MSSGILRAKCAAPMGTPPFRWPAASPIGAVRAVVVRRVRRVRRKSILVRVLECIVMGLVRLCRGIAYRSKGSDGDGGEGE